MESEVQKMIVRSQSLHESILFSRIIRTTIEKKSEGTWLVTATIEGDSRAVVLGRYPTEAEAIEADTNMYLAAWNFPDNFFEFPLSSSKA